MIISHSTVARGAGIAAATALVSGAATWAVADRQPDHQNLTLKTFVGVQHAAAVLGFGSVAAFTAGSPLIGKALGLTAAITGGALIGAAAGTIVGNRTNDEFNTRDFSGVDLSADDLPIATGGRIHPSNDHPVAYETLEDIRLHLGEAEYAWKEFRVPWDGDIFMDKVFVWDKDNRWHAYHFDGDPKDVGKLDPKEIGAPFVVVTGRDDLYQPSADGSGMDLTHSRRDFLTHDQRADVHRRLADGSYVEGVHLPEVR